MAAAGDASVEALREELACGICWDYSKNPMTIAGCGHNFCEACIEEYWQGLLENVPCPECGASFPKAQLEENRRLKNLVKAAGRLASESLCAAHGKPLKRFCQEEGALLCVDCDESPAHRDHTVVPVEEAQQPLKDKIQGCLRLLETTRRCTEKSKEGAKMVIKDFQIADIKDQLLAEVEQFCQFLKYQVQFLLPHLDEFQTDLAKKVEEACSKHAKQIDQLNSFISDLEKSCDQPATEVLKERSRLEGIMNEGEKISHQIMVESLKEYDTIENYFDGTEKYEENSFGDLEERHTNFVEHSKTVKEILQRFRGEMAGALRSARNDVLKPYAKATMAFDSDTAHPTLVLSEGEKGVHVKKQEKKQEKPFHQERFDRVPCVLGTYPFTEGRYYWEVDVEKGYKWGVGVARESVKRKDRVYFSPENGIWGIGYIGKYIAFTGSVGNNTLSLSEPLKKIKMYLDYVAGEVSFVNPDNNAVIFTFPPATFGGETIHPWFWVSKGKLTLPWSEDDYPDVEYLVSTGVIKPWEIHEYILPGC